MHHALNGNPATIFLTGFMGSGKSTLGKELALQLGAPFYDLDDYVERETGLRIPAIFQNYGEDYFRAKEANLLRALISEIDGGVVATGGGTPCFHDNMEFLLGRGFTVYLRVSAGVLFQRIDRESRPLLKDVPHKQQYKFIFRTLSQREKFYSRAHCLIDSDHISVDDIIDCWRKFYRLPELS